jgi:Tol biopolymer transport system component
MFETVISRWGSATLFAGILLAFLLPFATVSCHGDEITFTGVQVALHQVPDTKPHDEAGSLAEDVESESSAWALLALAAATAGLGLGVARRRGGGIAAAVGLLGMLMLLGSAESSLAEVDLHAGYVLALLGYLAAAVSHASAAWHRRRAAPETARPRSRRRRAAVAAAVVLVGVGAVAGCSALVLPADDYEDPEYVDFDTTDANPAWSPDGDEIAFERGGAVYTVKPDGSCPRRVTAGGEPAFSPKGGRLAVTRCEGGECTIVIVSRDGSDERGLVAGPFSQPSWSADGAHVYVSREEEDASTATWIVRADGTGLRRLTPPWVEHGDARWSIAAASEGDPTISPDGADYAFSSSDDPTVAIVGLQEAIFARDVEGGERRQLSDPSGNAGDYDPAWSPNGKLISFQRSGEIAVMDADGSNERVLTRVDGATSSAWSPDSRELVFTRELYGGSGSFSGSSALMIVDVESRDVRRLTWGNKPVAPCGSPG